MFFQALLRAAVYDSMQLPQQIIAGWLLYVGDGPVRRCLLLILLRVACPVRLGAACPLVVRC